MYGYLQNLWLFLAVVLLRAAYCLGSKLQNNAYSSKCSFSCHYIPFPRSYIAVVIVVDDLSVKVVV